MTARMDARHAEYVEKAIDCAAAAILAAAAAYSASRLGFSLVVMGAIAAAVFGVGLKVLGSVQAVPATFVFEPFDVGSLPTASHPDELLLTDADRLPAPPAAEESELLLDQLVPQSAGGEELVLDDILASLGEGSRVVRLFDPSAMPTPGELKTRIERHLDGQDGRTLSPDASQALHEALSELRRTLR
jgi:hypothetical protein